VSVPPEDCLFCALYREADHVHAVPGFVAIRDINPRADTHLLVIPERHVETFRVVSAFEVHEA
jgi:diadenosine tetraphosphate (Ap4A) HIT family hydrolase